MEQSSAQHNHHKPCLSVITTPNSTNTDSHTCTKSSHLAQNLKVKVYNNILHGKNEDYQTLSSEEEAPKSSASVSTSAATPYGLVSACLKCENSAGLNVSSKSEDEPSGLERTSENTEREQAQAGNNLLSAENIISNFINSTSATDNNASDAVNEPLNGTAPTGEATNTGNNEAENTNTEGGPTINFTDGLEFIMDKTPVITIFMSLICLSLVSGLGVSYLEGKYTHSFLFIILYVFLIYFLVGKVLKMFKAHGPATPNLFALLKGEHFYNVLDVIALIFVTLLADLRLAGAISSLNLGLYSLMAVIGLYSVFCRVSMKNKLYGVIRRLFPVLQLLAVIYKAENEFAFSWKVILCPGWIILGGFALKLSQGIFHVLTAFSGQNNLSNISRTSKIVSVVGLCLLMVDLVVLMLVLVGACRVLDSEDPEMGFLKLWLTVAQYLNSAMLFYSTITGADLLDFILTATEYFTQVEKIAARLRQLVTSKQETFVCRVSPTYYRMIGESEVNKEENVKNNVEEEEQNEDHEGFEDDVCYICCNKNADGVILDCGHGGICYECLIDYIGRKDGCMECRNKIQTVLKIEKEVKSKKIFKGEQVTKIMRPVESS